ncbi:hypothetical protein DDZ13_14715 [Coraliomargarita sinensis]|uniref:Sigma-54 factor interaction domain-containing protein n=1 Tax=Coraliomargarita sinensis TaxID=2174842 RepID=A0A317ZCM4_9BACT|nr:hypothetical protein [Coraliomargarita sinensis]PXA02904.1 hypothetical protein DDZ13_14715 [Coraliomargarita sinensis]
MEIHVLTQDAVSRERLVALLAEMELVCIIHEEVEPLLRAVKKLNKSDVVLYDLSLEDRLWAFERLYTSCRRTNLVGFEQLTKETSEGGQHCIDGMGHYLLLPQNLDRAKARMQEVLKGVARAAAPKKRKPKSRKKSKPQAEAKSLTDPSVKEKHEARPETCLTTARYLQAQSVAMQTFLTELDEAVAGAQVVLIDGEDGAEFEMVARELNYHANGDIYPLLVMDPMHLDFDELRDFEKAAAAKDEVHNCYVGLSAELNRSSANALSECLDDLRSLESPHLRIVISHVLDSETYFSETTGPMMRSLREHAATLELPALSERADDIPLIAQRIFSSLRIAHPFLRARTLSRDAIQYLQAECQEFDYSRIVRVLRNAMALGESEILTEKELKNLDDDSPTTQHLIESLADEKYFTTESSGVA